MNTDTQLLNGESETAYLWRLGNLKTSGILDISWAEVAELINKAFKDETDYISDSAYRKRYTAAKQFYDELFSKNNANVNLETKQELQRLKQSIRDERIAYNKQTREAARLDENFDYLAQQLKEIGKIEFSATPSPIVSKSERSMIVCLSDLHIGSEYNSAFGKYNSQIAKQRLDDYLAKILEIQNMFKCDTAYVCALGDLINGMIRISVQLANRENLIEQIKITSELIASFVAKLAKNFVHVEVSGVSGNHSRLVQNKDFDQKDVRADKLIIWVVQQILSHIDNVNVEVDSLDTTIASIDVNGKNYTLVHGDMDSATDAGIGKLITMLGYIPYCIISAHRHSMFYRELNNIKYIQAGSLCGGGGDYETTCRLTGRANQTVLVCKDNGEIDCIYNIELS